MAQENPRAGSVPIHTFLSADKSLLYSDSIYSFTEVFEDEENINAGGVSIELSSVWRTIVLTMCSENAPDGCSDSSTLTYFLKTIQYIKIVM